MLSTKSILKIVLCYCLWIVIAYAKEPATAPSYQCPAYLQLDGQFYALEIGHIYDGPIEDMVALKPEPVPDKEGVEPSFWNYGSPSLERPFYIKCLYKDTGHYLVLEAKGARRCTFQKGTPVKCE